MSPNMISVMTDKPITDKVLGRAMHRLFELEVDGERILDIPPATPHDLRRKALEKWGSYVDLVVNPRENVTRMQA